MTGQTISHYKILERIGEGGMGVVYKAHDTKLDRIVALKFLPQHISASGQDKARFVQEARAAAALNHPGICTIHEIGETPDAQLYIAMAYYEGQTLHQSIAGKRLPVGDCIDYATRIAEGLSAAHRKGIVHRDVKSSNIIVTPEGEVKIMDFGLAKTTAAVTMTQAGSAVGTVPYMSPEQARGDKVDHRTDIWSLGVVLYEMLTGRMPFRAEYPEALVYQILNQDPEPTGSSRTDVPKELEAIVMKCLEKDRERRYRNVQDLLADLSRVKGTPLSPAVAWSLVRRNIVTSKAGKAAGLIALVVLVAAIAVTFLARDSKIYSIGILPLENLSGDPEQEYFVAGMHDALIGELSRIGALRVISRRTMMQYEGTDKSVPEIARELNVGGVMEGSVERTDDRVQLRIRLIRALPEEESLWVETYERGVQDVMTIQTEVARSVAEQTGVELSPDETGRLNRTGKINPQVYEAYLRGMHYLGKPGLEDRRRGLEYLHEAVDLDPGNALSYAGLAIGYARLGHDDNVFPDALSRARAAAVRAVGLEADLPEAQSALGRIKLYHERDWEGAERALQKALVLNPSLAIAHYDYSWYLLLFDRVDEAIEAHKRAQTLDPLTPQNSADLAFLYAWVGRNDEALVEAGKALERDPEYPRGLWTLGLAYVQKGMFAEAVAAHERMVASGPTWLWGLGWTYAMAGRTEEARRIATQLEREPGPWNAWGLAVMYSALGDRDAAFRWLNYEPSHAWVPWARVAPEFIQLHGDPRFGEFLRRYNLPPLPGRNRASSVSGSESAG